MRTVDYAQKHIEVTAQENGIQRVTILNGKLYIEFPSGKCYELSDDEIKIQAEDFLQSELEGVRNS